MEKYFLLLCLYCIFAGCSEPITHQAVVTNYFKARDAANYKELKTYIADSITVVAGDYAMPYDQASFYEQFKWDSVFKPSYKIVKLEEQQDQIIAEVILNSIRNTFLKNEQMICGYKISFRSNKISKIEELDCKNADWNAWQKERDTLVSWTKKNHPELDGFIYDMTMKGAQNYVKAIGLYEAEME